MQSKIFTTVALILSICGLLCCITAYFELFDVINLYFIVIGLIISISSLVLSVKGNKIVKTFIGIISFLLSIIGIIAAVIILVQWMACATIDFIATSTSIGTDVFSKFF